MAGCATRTSFAGYPGAAPTTDNELKSNWITSWGQATYGALEQQINT